MCQNEKLTHPRFLLHDYFVADSPFLPTGDTMAHSFFSSAKPLSTSLRSALGALVTSSAEKGSV